jgi:glycosyltransferase involved in cell wall biosynthesis
MIIRPLLTFCLFTRNQEKYIRKAVEGALSQTYHPLEIVISDDCSTDNTFSIINEIIKDYQGAHTVKINRNNQNIGIVPNFNVVMEQYATGELIIMAAGDDISAPERVETVWNYWEKSDRKAYSFHNTFYTINEEGDILSEKVLNEEGFVKDTVFDFLRLNKSLPTYGAAQSFHRDAYYLFGPLNTKDVEDNNLAYRARILGEIMVINKPLVQYRIVGVSSKPRPLKVVRKIAAGYRTQTRKQLIEDLNTQTAQEKLPKSEIKKLIKVSKAGIKLSETESFIPRLWGWLLLLRYCSLQENYWNLVFVDPLFEQLLPKITRMKLAIYKVLGK